MREAFNRDRHKTSLFFSLVLRRQGRMAGSVRWLRHYVASLDPSALTREFAVILEASSYQAFGPEGEKLLSEKLAQWSTELRNRPGTLDEQIQRWVDEISAHRLVISPSQYPTLKSLSWDWPGRSADAVRRHRPSPRLLPSTNRCGTSNQRFPAGGFLDDILDTLVREYDDEELPLRREVIYHETVVEEKGDLDRAQAKSDLLHQAVEETTDVVSLQTMGAISPELLGVSVQTQRVAVGVSQSDFRTAVGRYCATYRAAALQDATLTFATNHSNIAAQYSFSPVTVRVSDGETGARRPPVRMDDDDAGAAREGGIDNSFYIKPGLIAAAIALVVFLINPGAGLIALAAAAPSCGTSGTSGAPLRNRRSPPLEQAREQGLQRSLTWTKHPRNSPTRRSSTANSTAARARSST